MTRAIGRIAATLACAIGMAMPAAAQDLDDFAAVPNGPLSAVAREASGSYVVGGSFLTIGGEDRSRIARVLPNGTVDASFNPGANGLVTCIAVDPRTGQIVIGGSFTAVGGGDGTAVARNRIARLNADGSVDASFDPGADGTVHALVFQSDRQLLVGGAFTTFGGASRLGVARLASDGSLDAGFNPGTVTANQLGPAEVRAIAVGRPSVSDPPTIFLGGNFAGVGGGTGATARVGVAAVTVDGTVLAFNANVTGTVRALHLTSQGLLIGGAIASVGGQFRSRIARVNALTGALDSFAPGANADVLTLAALAGGSIAAGGLFNTLGGPGLGTVAQNRIGFVAIDGTALPKSLGASGEVTSAIFEPSGVAAIGGGFLNLTTPPSSVGRTRLGRVVNLFPAEYESFSVTEDAASVTVTWNFSSRSTLPSWVEVTATTDGTTYTPLGSPAYVTSDHVSVTVPIGSVPTGPNVRIRARAVVGTGLGNGSQSIFHVEAPVQGRNLIENGDFSSGESAWLTFDLPSGSAPFTFTGGMAQFHRPGTQAVVFQQTGVAVPAGHRLSATLQVGNTDTVRKRFSVLLHDASFADLHVCTFWLPPSSPLATYRVTAHPVRPWVNATISIYAASDAVGGLYQLDNVSMVSTGQVGNDTTCDDPLSPPVLSPASAPTLLVNGDFATGAIAPWLPFGLITSAVTNQALWFGRQAAGTPSAVVLQPTGAPMTGNQTMRITATVGNVSGTRGRLTFLVHDENFVDFSACTFWLEPFETKDISIYSYATIPWTSAVLAVYPSTTITTVPLPFTLDNATLSRSAEPSMAAGTTCLDLTTLADARRR